MNKQYQTGFTAGAFDIIHEGHLNIFRRCKEYCDYLIVGVLTDDYIRITKGHSPSMPLPERMIVVNSIEYVDEVVPIDFHNTWKADAWKYYHFDVCFSGDDHENEPLWIYDKERLAIYGADMIFFPYTKTTSSSMIKDRLKGK